MVELVILRLFVVLKVEDLVLVLVVSMEVDENLIGLVEVDSLVSTVVVIIGLVYVLVVELLEELEVKSLDDVLDIEELIIFVTIELVSERLEEILLVLFEVEIILVVFGLLVCLNVEVVLDVVEELLIFEVKPRVVELILKVVLELILLVEVDLLVTEVELNFVVKVVFKVEVVDF